MPAGKGKEGAPTPACSDSIGIDALSDELLQHIIGFLQAQEAVRTSVLARRWRNLWKSAMRVRIVAWQGKFLGSVEKLCDFVDHLLQHRQGSTLLTFDLAFTSFGQEMSECLYKDDYNFLNHVNNWFWHAVSCRVQVLFLNAFGSCIEEPSLLLDNVPIKSRHLTMLELDGVSVQSRFLDFSNCPSLEQLKFHNCYFSYDSRFRIRAPNLVSLYLAIIWGMIPVLESMPSLETAFFATSMESEDTCDEDDCACEFCENYYNISGGTDSNRCVLLKGLSEAEHLTLFSGPQMYIFKMDLKCCPMFSKLRTLVLDDYWCVPDDFRALVCILKRSPVLQKLTLQLSSKKHRQQRERKGILGPMEGSAAILEHLKIIEVTCDAVDERIGKLTFFLCAFHIRFSLN
ncbi:unnamed protein product [Urochloa decumbens]|uniref:F-box domain-containing protein n=1 Tax=Urochloa decumbens TaxID=240449 RepID=A0ABC9E1Y6_9POAL